MDKFRNESEALPMMLDVNNEEFSLIEKSFIHLIWLCTE